jgi:hypothetical protein
MSARMDPEDLREIISTRSALQRPCSASAAYYGAANDAEHDQIIFGRVACLSFKR